MWDKIIKKLETILKANTKIQETFIYEVEKLEGTPACTIVPSDNESLYFTTADNERMYIFNVTLYVNRTVAPAGKNVEYNADKILRDLVDSVLDDFDKNYSLTGIENPTGYTFINLFALPSKWGYSGREDEYRVAQITIKCRVLVDVTLIS